jgi:hypothetical protein
LKSWSFNGPTNNKLLILILFEVMNINKQGQSWSFYDSIHILVMHSNGQWFICVELILVQLTADRGGSIIVVSSNWWSDMILSESRNQIILISHQLKNFHSSWILKQISFWNIFSSFWFIFGRILFYIEKSSFWSVDYILGLNQCGEDWSTINTEILLELISNSFRSSLIWEISKLERVR